MPGKHRTMTSEEEDEADRTKGVRGRRLKVEPQGARRQAMRFLEERSEGLVPADSLTDGGCMDAKLYRLRKREQLWWTCSGVG